MERNGRPLGGPKSGEDKGDEEEDDDEEQKRKEKEDDLFGRGIGSLEQQKGN